MTVLEKVVSDNANGVAEEYGEESHEYEVEWRGEHGDVDEEDDDDDDGDVVVEEEEEGRGADLEETEHVRSTLSIVRPARHSPNHNRVSNGSPSVKPAASTPIHQPEKLL